MALEGSLKEFGLADILQLIYFQRKAGVLTLESRLDRVRMLFYEGNVIGAESKRRMETNRLGKVLVKKGLLTEEDLNKTLEEQNATGEKVGNLLIKKGIVTKDQLKEIITSQITETVVQLFSWKEGIYEFSPQGVPVDKEIPVSIDTQHLLMEGLRIIDEWSLIEGKLTLETIFEKTGRTGIDLTSEEEEILQYIDGESDVSMIIDASKMDNFQASKLLVSMMEKGIIESKESASVAPEIGMPEMKKVYEREKVSVSALFVSLIAVTSLAVSLLIASMPLISLSMLNTDNVRIIQSSEDLDALRFKIEVYRNVNGLYPPSISQTGAGNDRWGKPYLYKTEPDYFVLFSAGPDGKEGTGDDIY